MQKYGTYKEDTSLVVSSKGKKKDIPVSSWR